MARPHTDDLTFARSVDQCTDIADRRTSRRRKGQKLSTPEVAATRAACTSASAQGTVLHVRVKRLMEQVHLAKSVGEACGLAQLARACAQAVDRYSFAAACACEIRPALLANKSLTRLILTARKRNCAFQLVRAHSWPPCEHVHACALLTANFRLRRCRAKRKRTYITCALHCDEGVPHPSNCPRVHNAACVSSHTLQCSTPPCHSTCESTRSFDSHEILHTTC